MMNYGISVLFRAIPVFMAFICFFLGGFIFLYGPDPAKYVAGPVVFFLGAICLALFATAGTIIRQLIHTYRPVFKYLLPGFGYLVAIVTFISGIWIFGLGTTNYLVSGHVICGVALITACVSTAATSSTKFYLIPQNSHSGSTEINKEGFTADGKNFDCFNGFVCLDSLGMVYRFTFPDEFGFGLSGCRHGDGRFGLYRVQFSGFGGQYCPPDPERLWGAGS